MSTFRIHDLDDYSIYFEYQFETGMTWADFIASVYNDSHKPDNYFTNSGSNMLLFHDEYGDELVVKDGVAQYITLTDTIEATDYSVAE